MAILWILINVMCTVNIRGHEANFYEAEARCHEAEIEAEARKSEAEAEAEAEWFGLEALTSLRCDLLDAQLTYEQRDDDKEAARSDDVDGVVLEFALEVKKVAQVHKHVLLLHGARVPFDSRRHQTPNRFTR